MERIGIYFFQIRYLGKDGAWYETSATIAFDHELELKEYTDLMDKMEKRLDNQYGENAWHMKQMTRVQ